MGVGVGVCMCCGGVLVKEAGGSAAFCGRNEELQHLLSAEDGWILSWFFLST